MRYTGRIGTTFLRRLRRLSPLFSMVAVVLRARGLDLVLMGGRRVHRDCALNLTGQVTPTEQRFVIRYDVMIYCAAQGLLKANSSYTLHSRTHMTLVAYSLCPP